MTIPTMPMLEINLEKIAHNAEKLLHLYGTKDIELMGVTKGVCGEPAIANVLVNKGFTLLADSKLTNIKKMRDAGIQAQFVLLTTPSLSDVESVVQFADISMNSELVVIQKISKIAMRHHLVHKIILMIEMGDLREGILPTDLIGFIKEAKNLPGIEIVGIAANFACFGGVKPTEQKLAYLSSLACDIETQFALPLSFVSGGNSANYSWFMAVNDRGKINNLRLGESIYLGRETVHQKHIPGLFTDAFTFVSEVIESKMKPSVPYGEIHLDAFGNHPQFEDKGYMRRAILGCGAQDVLVSGLTPLIDIDILGSSSNHIILDAKEIDLQVGDNVSFSLNYGALLSAMTSPYVFKKYIHPFPSVAAGKDCSSRRKQLPSIA